MDDSPPERLLAATARWTAAVRAAENERSDRLFADPWAEALAGAEGMRWRGGRPDVVVLPMVMRTRFFDDVLLRAAGEDGVRQAVILAAGYDTRAFRLDWPVGMRVFEVDRAELLGRKQAILDAAGATPRCERQAVAADLTSAWESCLAEAGLSADRPTIWLLEGFLFYLPSAVGEELLERVTRASAPGSQVGFDVVNQATFTSPLTRAWVEMQAALGAPWLGALDEPSAFLSALGWESAATECGASGVTYGRWPFPAPVQDPGGSHLWLVTARRR